MNQLCVPIPTASDTQHILEEVFALCRIPWIYDFIFRADPSADISMLLAPIQKRHALSAKIFVNATETSSRYAHTFDFNKEIMFYSIPAFSIGSITAGFCVEQPSNRLKDKQSSKDSLQCIRFVRDDKKGVFLHVSENENTGITEVDCLTHRSSTRRNRVRMKFDYRLLRSAMRTQRGILHPPDISPSLIYLNVSDEKRSCPVCHDPTAGECGCELPLKRPNHPLDFQYEAHNMGLYTGFYQGATVVRLCSAGHCVINATLQSGSVIQGELNSELVNKLHKLAVVDRISRIKQNPCSIIMPSSINVSALMSMDSDQAMATLEKHGQMETQDLNQILPKTIDQNDQHQQDDLSHHIDTENITDNIDAPNLFCTDIDIPSRNLVDTHELMDTNDMLKEMNTPDDNNQHDDDDEENNDTNICSPESLEQNHDIILPPEFDITKNQTDGCPSSASLCSKREESELIKDFSDERMENDDINKLSSTTEKTESQTSGPKRKRSKMVAKTEKTPQSNNIDSKQTQPALTEAEKVEIRKKRNREAAARSNLKRKLRNESVRRELAKLTQRTIRLRVREMMLREENTRLRTNLRVKRAAAIQKSN